MKRLLAVLLFAFAVPVSAAIPKDLADLAKQIEHFPETKGKESEPARLKKFFDLYWAARMREFPDLASYIGYKGVEDRVPDFSKEGFALVHKLSHLNLAALSSIDRAQLTPGDQLNYDLARRRFEIEIEGERFHGVDPWRNDYLLIDQMNDRISSMIGLVNYNRKETAHDYDVILARLHAFAPAVDDALARLDEALKLGITPPRVTLRTAVKEVGEMVVTDLSSKESFLRLFDKMPESIPAADRERIRKEAERIIRDEVNPAFARYRDYLAKTYVPNARESLSVSALPDGRAWYAWLLRYYTTTNLTPDEIHALGLSEVARIRAEMEKVIASTGYKGTFREFCDYLRTDPKFFYDKPEDLVAGYRDIATRIDPELPKLFGRLPRLPYGVTPMGNDGSPSAPSAMYSNGSIADHRAGKMLVNTYDLKARPKWGMESLTAHEAVRGHHIQYALVEEIGELPEWRKWDVYPVFSEGWGLYAERLGEELGLYKDPYSKFGQLNNEMWRAIRLVVDTGLHDKGWTRQQTVDYCKANSAKTDLEIENEVDRYIVQPGSVPAYKIGELKILELRHYAEKQLGVDFDIRKFHDEILGNGQLPLDLLEARITAWVTSQQTHPR